MARIDDLLDAALKTLPEQVSAAIALALAKDSETDGTANRRSTFENAHSRLRIFSGRQDPAGRDEQYERMYLLLLDASPDQVAVRTYEVGSPQTPASMEHVMDEFVRLCVERNPDFYEYVDGSVRRTSG